jgi:inhibitor of cysteine peptidase
MKKSLVLGLATIMLLSVLAIGGCSSGAIGKTANAPKTQTIDITLDEFAAQNNIVKDVELAVSGTLTVKLGSNPTTGYSWGDAVIGDTNKIAEATHQFIEPTGDEAIVGAPGQDVLTFDGKATGTTTIKISYSRPWEGGDKDTYTLTINVIVK